MKYFSVVNEYTPILKYVWICGYSQYQPHSNGSHSVNVFIFRKQIGQTASYLSQEYLTHHKASRIWCNSNWQLNNNVLSTILASTVVWTSYVIVFVWSPLCSRSTELKDSGRCHSHNTLLHLWPAAVISDHMDIQRTDRFTSIYPKICEGVAVRLKWVTCMKIVIRKPCCTGDPFLRRYIRWRYNIRS